MRKCMLCGKPGEWFCEPCKVIKDERDEKYQRAKRVFHLSEDEVGILIGRGRRLRKPKGHGYSGGDNACPLND